MIHRRQHLLSELLHHEIEIPTQMYLTFLLSMTLFLLSFTWSAHKPQTPSGTVLGAETKPQVSVTQQHLSTTVDPDNRELYLIQLKITVLNTSSVELQQLRLQSPFTQGWDTQLLEPEVMMIETIGTINKNEQYDGYSTSVINNPNDVLLKNDQAEVIMTIRVKQPTKEVATVHTVMLQATANDEKITNLSAFSLFIPQKHIQPN